MADEEIQTVESAAETEPPRKANTDWSDLIARARGEGEHKPAVEPETFFIPLLNRAVIIQPILDMRGVEEVNKAIRTRTMTAGLRIDDAAARGGTFDYVDEDRQWRKKTLSANETSACCWCAAAVVGPRLPFSEWALLTTQVGYTLELIATRAFELSGCSSAAIMDTKNFFREWVEKSLVSLPPNGEIA